MFLNAINKPRNLLKFARFYEPPRTLFIKRNALFQTRNTNSRRFTTSGKKPMTSIILRNKKFFLYFLFSSFVVLFIISSNLSSYNPNGKIRLETTKRLGRLIKTEILNKNDSEKIIKEIKSLISFIELFLHERPINSQIDLNEIELLDTLYKKLANQYTIRYEYDNAIAAQICSLQRSWRIRKYNCLPLLSSSLKLAIILNKADRFTDAESILQPLCDFFSTIQTARQDFVFSDEQAEAFVLALSDVTRANIADFSRDDDQIESFVFAPSVLNPREVLYGFSILARNELCKTLRLLKDFDKSFSLAEKNHNEINTEMTFNKAKNQYSLMLFAETELEYAMNLFREGDYDQTKQVLNNVLFYKKKLLRVSPRLLMNCNFLMADTLTRLSENSLSDHFRKEAEKLMSLHGHDSIGYKLV